MGASGVLRKIQQLGRSKVVVIPIQDARALGWDKGTMVRVYRAGERLIIEAAEETSWTDNNGNSLNTA